MIYMVKKMRVNGKWRGRMKESTTPKGVGFRVGFIKTG